MLHYSYPQVVVQEVPDEIALALSISGCPLNCKGCHSSETFKPTFGSPLTPDVLQDLVTKNKHITCVLFYGGEWQPDELVHLLQLVSSSNLKVALYTGLDYREVPQQLLSHLDVIKVGPYIAELGGIGSPNTNQRIITFNRRTPHDHTKRQD